MIADMISNKSLHPIDTKLFIKGWKLNTFLGFITQSYFPVPHTFIMKIPNRRKLQQIPLIIHLVLTSKTL